MSAKSSSGILVRIASGLAMLREYRREWLKSDVAAGLSVAAVALPVAIAYAQLAGFPPVVGLSRVPGLVLYRFTASLIFYNASYFRRRVLAVATADPGASWLVVDFGPIAHVDSTGADTLVAVADELARRGIRIAIGGALPQVRRMLERSGALERLGPGAVFPSLRAAVEACESRGAAPQPI